jgi:hypothetical protein
MNQRTKFSFSRGKKNGMLLVFLLAGCLMNSFAQINVQVMKNGIVVSQHDVSDIDSVIFYNPFAPVNTPSTDALVVNKSAGLPTETLLDDIRKLVFTSSNFLLMPGSGSTISYPFASITKVSFEGGNTTGMNIPAACFDVSTYLTLQGEVIVLTDAFIYSLTLFGTEGKILGKSHSNTLSVSHLPAGIYLLRVETVQGTVVKKVIKHSNII